MKIKVAFLSAGLGNISRGFEVSTALWFEEIKSRDCLRVKLFAGGDYKNATRVPNFSRNGALASLLKKLKVIKDGARLEQLSYSIALLYHLLLYRPDFIWLQEGTLGEMLIIFRRFLKLKYKIIFTDGAPAGPAFSKKFDLIIFLHEYALREAIKEGIDERKCKVIPHLSKFPVELPNKGQARKSFGLPEENFVILCVAAWNRHHKRIDYLIEEVAQLGLQNVTLLLCGQPDLDTVFLKETCKQLKLDVQWHTLEQAELSLAYSASDLFILPSLKEGLPAVLIEAGAHYLPIICHPHPGGKYALGEDYSGLTDLSMRGNLAKKILQYKSFSRSTLRETGIETFRIIQSRFDETKLHDTFVEFVHKAYQKGN